MIAITIIIIINFLEKASHHLSYFKPSHQLLKINCPHYKEEKEQTNKTKLLAQDNTATTTAGFDL